MYRPIFVKIRAARPTGTTARVEVLGQRICFGKVCPPLYHVGLLVHQHDRRYIFEHGPIRYDPHRDVTGDSVVIPMPPVRHSIDDILAFEQTLPRDYVVGIRDCRHHVLDLLDYLYDCDCE